MSYGNEAMAFARIMIKEMFATVADEDDKDNSNAALALGNLDPETRRELHRMMLKYTENSAKLAISLATTTVAAIVHVEGLDPQITKKTTKALNEIVPAARDEVDMIFKAADVG